MYAAKNTVFCCKTLKIRTFIFYIMNSTKFYKIIKKISMHANKTYFINFSSFKFAYLFRIEGYDGLTKEQI